ncbi:MAG: YebC/PmpR family DNA-binding transcriptional regulator, partial [Peptococcaceae bacterium]|nr:YebC/PmpR family DNA-binding transcriptional regulator [Peptococcaceae bacterium]
EGKYEFVLADITMLPNMYTALDPTLQKQMDKLMDQLEEDDDVQNVYHNMEM